MAQTRAGVVLVVASAVMAALVSGGTSADPQTPPALPGKPPPFLGTAVVGSGGLTAAIDSYGDLVDLRSPGPAGRALIDNSAARQAAGTVPAETGIVPKAGARMTRPPLWEADWVRQRYWPGTNVHVTEAGFGSARVEVVYAAAGDRLACLTRSSDVAVWLSAYSHPAPQRLRCDDAAARALVHDAAAADRRWLSSARPLEAGAPGWARQLYGRSLLTLRALTDRRTGAVAAGARDSWAYVWPRDAAAAALAFAAAGYGREAGRVSGFLRKLDLDTAARFHGDGEPVEGREAQGDAWGWAAVAARAAGGSAPRRRAWRGLSDYQEGGVGDYLGNALASTGGAVPFVTPLGLVRRAGDPSSGLDSSGAWAVRPFPQPALFPAARRTLLALVAEGGRFGITPGAAWPHADPWTAPTAWSAWSLAALSDRERREGDATAAAEDRTAALGLLADLRRAATPAGLLPERVDANTGVPRSTTPLAWSHAFAILALRQLWPG